MVASEGDINPDANSGAIVGTGMTSVVRRLHNDRVIKTPKAFDLDSCTDEARGTLEYLNDINREALENEKRIYERLGKHDGIIKCFETSAYGIELAFAAQGNLEDYIKRSVEPHESTKADWILTLTDALSFIHSRRVFVDEIALRNILMVDGQPKLSDFGQSILLPLAVDMETTCESELTARIDILHLGFVIYSIAAWRAFKYYYFDAENPKWPSLHDLPAIEDIFCGDVIKKCWMGEFASAHALDEVARALLADISREKCMAVIYEGS